MSGDGVDSQLTRRSVYEAGPLSLIGNSFHRMRKRLYILTDPDLMRLATT